ncbi:phosphogluconate dehydrogenase (NAD(+)-dependent, decarboxylating) [Deinococcus maricopensis]|uniref:6-phosphogluconate dehydrogenase, decarboxylating n=1 Tax=Deinococcus maricopensis (strain DSM 21211 / LMG 22137 / NRRL B-23946 / LB-34) TaxID=709986 RepID=E8UAC7_DEIML|nr:decarboxylating 6-phosphogluconate dehydrogenase [Deinococcus maricopensis]ADV68016.1 6-phosphogluconate dehydrogenase, decarboxylating [Deinococcus maricopensis DSM 21211]
MNIGMIGLGKMGGNMVARLVQGGVNVVGYDLNAQNVQHVVGLGARGATDLDDLLAQLGTPGERAVWIMVPAGHPTEATIQDLAARMTAGDIIIDGGNSNFKDTKRRAEELARHGIFFVDVGTSGGIWGLQEGYAMMIGGEEGAVERLRPVFEALAPARDRGWGRMGPSGSGHYVKMVHNGIEYGMMQAYAEGFELMQAKQEFGLDLAQIAELWRHGSVVRSWLLDLTAEALKQDVTFAELSDYVADSGEGRWTIIDSIEQGVPTPVITLSTQMRFRSQQDVSYAGQMLSAMRRAFGGHAVKKIEHAQQEVTVEAVKPHEAHTPEVALNTDGAAVSGTDAKVQLGESGQQRVKSND